MFGTRELISVVYNVLYFLCDHSRRTMVGSVSTATNILRTCSDDAMAAAADLDDDNNWSTPSIVPFGRTLVAGSFRPITWLISGYKSTLSNGWAMKFLLKAGPEAMKMARIRGCSLSYPCVPALNFSLAEKLISV